MNHNRVHSLCSVQSSVCNGTTSNNWIANSTFLPDTFRIDVSNPKHNQTLAEYYLQAGTRNPGENQAQHKYTESRICQSNNKTFFT